MSQVKELTTEADLSGQPLAVIYITSDNPEAVPAELRNLAEILQTRESPVNVYCATPSVLTDSSLGENVSQLSINHKILFYSSL